MNDFGEVKSGARSNRTCISEALCTFLMTSARESVISHRVLQESRVL